MGGTMLAAAIQSRLAHGQGAEAPDDLRAYRRRLLMVSDGFRERRANEPYDMWPQAPAVRAPIVDPAGETLSIRSPDDRLELQFTADRRAPCWTLLRNGKALIAPSRTGFVFRGAPDLEADLVVADHRIVRRDAKWEQPWGEVRTVRDRHIELTVDLRESTTLARKITLVFRLYDDGFAVRAISPERIPGAGAILEELSEFVLPDPGQSRLWWLPGWGFARDEYLYRNSTLAEIRSEPDARALHTPLTVEVPGAVLCFHEAALRDYAGMNLAPQPGGILRCDLVPWSDGDRVKIDGPFQTPWRAVLVADAPHKLVESTLLLNLNEPAKFAVPWFKPGKYVGIWWGFILNYWDREPGIAYGATTERALQYIDFAAKHGFGLLIESWNRGWDGWRDKSGIDFARPSRLFDEHRVLAAARAKGVPLIGHHETSGDVDRYEMLRDEAFASLARWRAGVVKTGYVASQPGLLRRVGGQTTKEWHYGQYMVGHQQRLIEYAAKRQVAVLAHETVKDTGLRRTYPNFISRECAVGVEYSGFDTVHQGTPPSHEPTLAFTRMLSGPMDYTPGIFDLDLSGLTGERGRIRREVMSGVRPNSTLARQLALYVVIYSPMQMAADFIENYEGHAAFPFIRDVPVDWEQTVGLDGRIGQYAAIARKDRHSPDWYIGAIGNGEPQKLRLDLGFLDPRIPYEVTVWGDAADAHYQTNPEAWTLRRPRVRRTGHLTLALAAGGGAAVRLRPLATRSGTPQ